MLKPGYWRLTSKSDPRWNSSGRGMVGGFSVPKECRAKIEELEVTLGEIPDDLTFSCMKD